MNAVVRPELPITPLRPYQTDCVAALRASYASGHRAPLLALPTAGGKTIIFAAVTAGAVDKGRRVLVVAHRRELIRQASAKLTDAGVPHGIILAGFDANPDAPVQVASVQTLAQRPDALSRPDLIVLDEAHHCRAGQWRALLAAHPEAKLLGVTATPARLDGKGLGIAAGGCFDDLVVGPPISQLVAEGYLATTRIFAPPERLDLSNVRVRGGDYVIADLERAVGSGRIVGDCIEQYRQHANHQAAIAFCVSVAHASDVAERFRDVGYGAVCVHGGTPKDERDAAIAGLADGSVELLTSCDLISEGLDVPVVGAVILLRPTKSLVLYMQQVGRGMRPAPGKDALIVLDHVNNTLVHGLPDLERRWTLDGIAREEPVAMEERERGGGARPRFIAEHMGNLHEITAERLAAIRRMSYRQVLGAKLSERELAAYAAHHGYKRGWVWPTAGPGGGGVTDAELDQCRHDGALLFSIVSRKVELKRKGKDWKGRCPFHSEKTPSFHVYEDGHYHCFGCNEHGTVFDFIMQTERIDFPAAADRVAVERGIASSKPRAQNSNGNGAVHDDTWQPIVPPPADAPKPSEQQLQCDVLYEYPGTNDRLLCFVRRLEAKNGKRKQFFPLTYGVLNGKRGWHDKAPATPRPLYGLNRLSHAAPDAVILLCEGEKAADAAQRLFPDHVAMSWMGGASADGGADLSPLKGRNVILWPDADQPGRDVMTRIAKRLTRIRLLDTADLPDGYDAANLEGEGCDDPDAWLAARLREPEPQTNDHELPQVLWRDVRLSDWAGRAVPERRWVVPEWIPREQVTGLYGVGGINKTDWLIQLLMSSTAGLVGCRDAMWLIAASATDTPPAGHAD